MGRYDQSRAPIFEALEKFRQERIVPFDVPDISAAGAIRSWRRCWGSSAWG